LALTATDLWMGINFANWELHFLFKEKHLERQYKDINAIFSCAS